MLNIADSDFCDKRDKANPLLKSAFDIIFPPELYYQREDHVWKNDQWYRLYNVYQCLEDAFGMRNYKPMQMTDVPLPKVKRTEDKTK